MHEGAGSGPLGQVSKQRGKVGTCDTHSSLSCPVSWAWPQIQSLSEILEGHQSGMESGCSFSKPVFCKEWWST